jgi:hypothetical protein
VSSLITHAGALASAAKPPSFLSAGKPTAAEIKLYAGSGAPAEPPAAAKKPTGTTPILPPVRAAVAAPVTVPLADDRDGKKKEQLTTRERNKLQQQKGQATFTLKDGRDMPDLYRPEHSKGPSGMGGVAGAGGQNIKKRPPVNLLTDGISAAAATRDTAVRDKQYRKVQSGQSFEGRTWKSEQEMVMRQQYD